MDGAVPDQKRQKETKMAYINQEGKAKISAALKPVLLKYGMKGSLSVRNHSTIALTLKSGPIDFQGKGVNVYCIDRHHEGVARDFLNEALEAMRSADWFDKSDISTDYFYTAYYIDISVGRYDKPYEVAA